MKRIAFVLSALIALPVFAEDPPPVPSKQTAAAVQARLNELANKRVKKVAAQPMPGLGVMPGDADALRIKPVRISADRTEILYVSATLPNRISTPFTNPQAIDNQSKDFEVQTIGQSVYVTMTSNKSVALYITGDKPNDPVYSLTLVPKSLPAQTFALQIDKSPSGGSSAANDAEGAPESNIYTDKLRYVLRQLALGKTPEGFSEGALPKSVARMGDVSVYPLTRYSGPNYDIFRYRVEAVADSVELDEPAFYSDGVRAVAFFPNASLRKGETTEMYVLTDKSATETK